MTDRDLSISQEISHSQEQVARRNGRVTRSSFAAEDFSPGNSSNITDGSNQPDESMATSPSDSLPEGNTKILRSAMKRQKIGNASETGTPLDRKTRSEEKKVLILLNVMRFRFSNFVCLGILNAYCNI